MADSPKNNKMIILSPNPKGPDLKNEVNIHNYKSRKSVDITNLNIEKFNVFYTNAQSIRNKKYELICYINAEAPDLICITESWINENILRDTKEEYEIENYNMYMYQRRDRIGGGILIYVRDLYDANEIHNIKENINIESIWLDIQITRNEKLRLGVFYVPPGSKADLVENIVDEIKKGTTEHLATWRLQHPRC